MKSTLCSILTAATLLAPTSAFAGESPSAADIKRAAAAYDRGRDSFRAEDYVEAAEHFEAADAHAPSSSALSLAIAARKEARQLARAATLAALGMAREPDDEELVSIAEPILAEADSSLHRIEVTCDEACDLLLDNRIVHGVKATSRVIYADPGPHVVRGGWTEGRALSQTVEGVAGGTSEIQFVAPDLPVAESKEALDGGTDASWNASADSEDQTADRGSKGGWSPTVFWTGVGVTTVGVGLSTFLGLKAINEPGRDAVREACRGQDESCPEYQEGLTNQRNATIAIGATTAVGLFTIATGLFLTDWGSDDSSARTPGFHVAGKRESEVTVTPLIGLGSLGAMGTF